MDNIIKREDITKDTPTYILVQYLESVIVDKQSREKLDDFDQGLIIGQLKVIDMVKSLCL